VEDHTQLARTKSWIEKDLGGKPDLWTETEWQQEIQSRVDLQRSQPEKPLSQESVSNEIKQELHQEVSILINTFRFKLSGQFGIPFKTAVVNSSGIPTTEEINRITFWPAHSKDMPFLWVCARRILCAQGTSMENERYFPNFLSLFFQI